MAIPVLVITPTRGFGELICQVMEEAGSYVLTLETNATDALAYVKEQQPALCILDADLEDMPLNELAAMIRTEIPDLLLIVIPPDNSESLEEELDTIQADGFLSKPFYLPDLLTTVENVVRDSGVKQDVLERVDTEPFDGADNPEIQPDDEPELTDNLAPEWLQDVSQAAKHLAGLSLESSSQAALITRADKVWAYAGELPQPAVQELAVTVSRHFIDDGSGDLARFIHLDATDSGYMLYATGLGGDFVLSMVFDAEMPFSKMRSQANNMAEALASPSPEDFINDTVPVLVEPDHELQIEEFHNLLADVPPPIPNDWVPEIEPSAAGQSFLAELLEGEDPEPEPIMARPEAPSIESSPSVPVMHQSDSQPVDVAVEEEDPEPEEMAVLQPEPLEAELDLAPVVAMHYDETLPDTMPSATADDLDLAETMPSESLSEDDLGDTLPSELQDVPDLAETMKSASSRAESLAETMPSQSGLAADADVVLTPASPSVYSLTYACVLIPRFPKHFLTGDLATRLAERINQLCVAFGWRLEHLSLRPEYMQWLVNVPPTTSPGYLMRIIRQHTSRRLFSEFPLLGEENPSGDFWAPGYLILSSNQPPLPKLVKDFIHNTRVRQGIFKE